MNTLWLLFIVLHAASGVFCFISGLMLLSPKQYRKRPWILTVFLTSLIGLIIFLIGATVSHWGDLTVATRIIYTSLFGLSLYMLWRALQARHKLKLGHMNMSYVDDIGFPLISLFNGFIIVALIDLQMPPVVVVIGAVVAAVAGGQIVKRRKQSLGNGTR